MGKRSVRPTMTSRRLVNYTTVASAMLAILGVRTVEGGYETRYSRLMLNVNAASPGSSYTKIPKQNYGGSSYTVIPRQVSLFLQRWLLLRWLLLRWLLPRYGERSQDGLKTTR